MALRQLYGLLLGALLLAAMVEAEAPDLERGEYILRATGGCSCHTDISGAGVPMAGGRRLETPFGGIYSTNITPDPETGIGDWSDDDFIRSMTEGVGPDGTHFFPIFPYTSFARMSRRDLLDLKAYLFSLTPVRQEAPPPQMPLPFRWRSLLGPWKALHLTRAPFTPVADSSDSWNRGAYLVTALAHCGECHTPRNLLGGLKTELGLVGSDQPDGETAPNITPDSDTGIGEWSEADLVWYLQTGLLPDGDSAQGTMLEVIEQGYQYLEEQDLRAIATYLLSRPARPALR